jgi:hypothetical protein
MLTLSTKSMKSRLFVLLAVAFVAMRVHGWDNFGHMAVAYVAYQELTPELKQRVKRLLELNPQFQTWSSWISKGTSESDRNLIIFMLAATWPDEIKGLPHQPPPINPRTGQPYVADGSDNGNRPDGSPNASANEGFTDNSMHKYWHFIDTPFSRDNTPLPGIPCPNAQERIALFRSVLSSDASDELKSYDLAWVLHLVGDLHQPLHCCTRVSNLDKRGDSGGNNVIVGSIKLHQIWDDLLGTGSEEKIPLKVIKVAKKLPTADALRAADSKEKDWVQEGFQMAQTNVYVSPIDSGDGPFELTGDYKTNAKDLARQQVALAGARLANFLRDNLK